MQFLGKNVATGVYTDLQLWALCLLARAWISGADTGFMKGGGHCI